MHTILVVDDEEKIREIVVSYLVKSGYRALAAKTGEEALCILAQQEVSLVLLDLMLPDCSGEEICQSIRAQSQIPIIMMTAKVEEESIIHGLTIGADDYVTKPFSPRQLMARISAILRRSGQHQPAILRAGSLGIDTENRTVSKNGTAVPLTPNEYKILALLTSRPHKIFTRDEIIACALSSDYDGMDRTIDSHIKNLRQKLEDDPKSPQYILTVYGLGYRFGGEGSL